MAMTNEMIILVESVKLMEQGVLKGTGQFVQAEINGEIKELEIPEEIHTYKKWKSLGYQVRKGEKSKIKFAVWTYKGRRELDEESGEEIEKGRCYMKNSCFFTKEQVDKIA